MGEEREAFKQVLMVIVLDHRRPVGLKQKTNTQQLRYSDDDMTPHKYVKYTAKSFYYNQVRQRKQDQECRKIKNSRRKCESKWKQTTFLPPQRFEVVLVVVAIAKTAFAVLATGQGKR